MRTQSTALTSLAEPGFSCESLALRVRLTEVSTFANIFMYADFHVLTRVKRKRKKEDQQVSSGVGRYGSTPVNTSKSLGSFIQSALSKAKGQEEEEEEGEGKQAATGGRGEGGSKKGSLRARKKLKLGGLCMKYEVIPCGFYAPYP